MLLVVGAIVWGVTRGEDDPVVSRPSPSLSVTPEPSASTPTTSGSDLAVAEESLAAALLGQGLMDAEQAECAAGEWIANAGGLDAMVAEGLFDENFTFVDVPADELSPAMQSAAATATITCVTP